MNNNRDNPEPEENSQPPEPEKSSAAKGENRDIMRALGLFTQLGITMAVCVWIGVMAGKYLDKLLGTSPWLLVACALIGAAAAFKALYDIVIKEWL